MFKVYFFCQIFNAARSIFASEKEKKEVIKKLVSVYGEH